MHLFLYALIKRNIFDLDLISHKIYSNLDNMEFFFVPFAVPCITFFLSIGASHTKKVSKIFKQF